MISGAIWRKVPIFKLRNWVRSDQFQKKKWYFDFSCAAVVVLRNIYRYDLTENDDFDERHLCSHASPKWMKKHKWYISGVHNIVVLSIWFFSWDTFSDLKYICTHYRTFQLEKRKRDLAKFQSNLGWRVWTANLRGCPRRCTAFQRRAAPCGGSSWPSRLPNQSLWCTSNIGNTEAWFISRIWARSGGWDTSIKTKSKIR